MRGDEGRRVREQREASKVRQQSSTHTSQARNLSLLLPRGNRRNPNRCPLLAGASMPTTKSKKEKTKEEEEDEWRQAALAFNELAVLASKCPAFVEALHTDKLDGQWYVEHGRAHDCPRASLPRLR